MIRFKESITTLRMDKGIVSNPSVHYLQHPSQDLRRVTGAFKNVILLEPRDVIIRGENVLIGKTNRPFPSYSNGSSDY